MKPGPKPSQAPKLNKGRCYVLPDDVVQGIANCAWQQRTSASRLLEQIMRSYLAAQLNNPSSV
jgi:hypothetical protein